MSKLRGQRETERQRISPEEWKQLFMELWTACQGIVDATDSLKADFEWAEKHPEPMYPVGKAGQGAEFAVFRARRRLSYQDFLDFREVVDEIKSRKIPHNNQVDRRGHVE